MKTCQLVNKIKLIFCSGFLDNISKNIYFSYFMFNGNKSTAQKAEVIISKSLQVYNFLLNCFQDRKKCLKENYPNIVF